MADKRKGEEYQHPEEDYGAGVEPQAGEPQVMSRKAGKSRFFNKRLLIIIGLVVGILVVYQFVLKG